VTEIPNKSGDAQNPLRYIDRYGLPGSGPVPGVTLGYPAEGEQGKGVQEQGGAPEQQAPAQGEKAPESAAAGAAEEKGRKPEEKRKAKKPKKGEGKQPAGRATREKAGEPRAATQPAPVLTNPLKDATLLIATAKFPEALKEIDRVLAIDKTNPTAHYLKAVVYVHQREYTRAREEYNEVMRLAPNTELAQRAQEGLTKLR
jgi:Flp pilus assembly protein TadD